MDGTPFGRYLLRELIGEGGMGQVYRAYDTVTDRLVALKVLPPHSADDPAFRERFRREAHAVAGLREPHVVPIHDYGEIDGRLFLDMRLIEGTTLQTMLSQHGPMPPHVAASVVSQAAAALDAAHAAGLVHRDVKPSNLLVTDREFVYLIDFGIARAVGETGMTSTGAAIGTMAYMAPERFSTGQADARSDVYALACVLHECLTGVRPYSGDSLEQQIAGHLTVPPPKPSSIRDGIPASFDEVIERGMAKNPDARYRTAGELAAAAHKALSAAPGVVAAPAAARHTPGVNPIPSTLVFDPGVAGTAVLVDPLAPLPVPKQKSISKRSAAPFVVATVILAACAGVIGYATHASGPVSRVGSTSAADGAAAPESQTSATTGEAVGASSVQGWPGFTKVGLAPSPEFPQSLPQWALSQSWTDLPRAFDTGWTKISGPDGKPFTPTMNHCGNWRYLVRWRAIHPDVVVTAGALNPVDNTDGQVTGNAGWMDLDNCHVPAFQAVRGSLADLTVSVQSWNPAP
ncbi:serine/threonine-protein kinase [Prescottella agglutinans]|uniref:non-specific serine/threonine protein kinase n=1 Tax=Prescottella agglutinans TaxID=1644129 RepID=A0ABT6MKS0_9NOCA|nr:serine/threonine-protein kinase [Prescottella agglutinans]MDH6284927.1 putative Ser/Thr protein kinase [Prescottella agglutinans]